MKACYAKNDKLQILGGFLTHTQPVNCMASASDLAHALLTGSQDKSVKVWMPSKETLEHMATVLDF